VRSFARLGSSVSVLDFRAMGSTLSLRSCCRLGSAVSVYGMARLGSAVSVLDFAHIGSSMSLRGFCRLGASLSTFGLTRLGSSLSVLDLESMGSSVSLRSFARLGSATSDTDGLRLGASLSLRSGMPLESTSAPSEAPSDRGGAPVNASAEVNGDRLDLTLRRKAASLWSRVLANIGAGGAGSVTTNGEVASHASEAARLPTTGGNSLTEMLYESISDEL